MKMNKKANVTVTAPQALELETLAGATGGSQAAEDVGYGVGWVIGRALREFLDHPVKMDAGKI